jgi:hypothetical protein
MFKSHLTLSAAAFLVLVASAQAQVQQTTPATAITPSTAQGAQAGTCADAVLKAKDNVFLRIQQSTGSESRASAQVHLSQAGNAAESGDEARCWKELDVSRQFVR